jgi:hypothetical protein
MAWATRSEMQQILLEILWVIKSKYVDLVDWRFNNGSDEE